MSGGAEDLVCPKCGAANPPGAFDCRVCQALLLGGKYAQLKSFQRAADAPHATVKQVPVSTNSSEPAAGRSDWNPAPQFETRPPPIPVTPNHARQFSLASLLLLITLIAICLGLFVTHPGLGIFASIALFPAFIRTSLVIRRRAQLGWADPGRDRWSLFLGSVGFVLTGSWVMAIVGAVTFFFVCLRTFSFGASSRSPTQDRDVTIIYVFAGAAALLGVWALAGSVRRRWRRDTELPTRGPRERDV